MSGSKLSWRRKLTDKGNKSLTTLADDQTHVAITIYNDGTGLVKDTRSLNLPDGNFDLIFMDVASQIDPTSVHFVSRTNPGSIGILEQNYEYDLVSTEALYKRHIDMPVKLRNKQGREMEGVLLAYDQGKVVIQTVSGIVIVNNATEAEFSELPEGLITRPTLRWSLISAKAGVNVCEMSYLSDGMNWKANYVAVVDKDDDNLDLAGWVTIDNTSGASYKDANLKLVAGEVHRAPPEEPPYVRSPSVLKSMALGAGAPSFEEESFFEYHLYTLQRPATVLNNQQKQISLLEADGVSVTKVFLFEPRVNYWYAKDSCRENVKVHLEFKNSEESGLGMPLPKGLIRVYKADSEGALQFIGEDRIDHTPKDEDMTIIMGEAFDVVGERTVLDQKKIGKKKHENIWDYEVEVRLRNHKDEDIEVKYVDRVWGDWEVKKSTHKYVEKSATKLEFVIKVKADSEEVLTYSIRRQI